MPQDEPSVSGEGSARGARRTTTGDNTDPRFEVALRGVDVDPDTRCAHYHGPADIVAIQLPCCGTFYPCHQCHVEAADHGSERWSRESFDTPAVRCGACTSVLTIEEYLATQDVCPRCGADFNPRCADHYHLYFQVE